MTSRDKFFDKWVSMVEENYKKVYGTEKWYSLTSKEKHDVVMFATKDMMRALDVYGQNA